jgi:hypothetical protein
MGFLKDLSILDGVNDQVFIETGTCNGYTIETVAKLGRYRDIYSVEYLDSSPQHDLNKVRERLSPYKNVHIFQNNSVDFLNKLLPTLNEPCTFWLDAHYGGTAPEYAYQGCGIPLRDELTIIKNHHIKTHTILIDDVRCFHEYRVTPYEAEQILKSINPEYKITYEDCCFPKDIIVAKI